MQCIYIIFLIFISLGCGRDQILDRENIELLLDDPWNSDVQPLSAYHGQWKQDIVEAKNIAELMGLKFPPIIIRHGEGKDENIGSCSPRGVFGNRIVFFPGTFTVEPNTEEAFNSFVELFVHEWGHCSLGLGHQEEGVMQARQSDLKTNELLIRLQHMNEEHNAGMNLLPLLKELTRRATKIPIMLPLALYLKIIPTNSYDRPVTLMKRIDISFDDGRNATGTAKFIKMTLAEAMDATFDCSSVADDELVSAIQTGVMIADSRNYYFDCKPIDEVKIVLFHDGYINFVRSLSFKAIPDYYRHP